MLNIKQLLRKQNETYWGLGFVRNGLDGVMNDNPLQVDWVEMPKEGWFADPFILDLDNNLIQLLVEEMPPKKDKGVISLLKIDRHSLDIISKKTVLELPTHLSFPCIMRKNGEIYIYPESANSGKLDVYFYDPINETANYLNTICDDVVWDSCITDFFGDNLLFTSAHNDFILDIYKWDHTKNRFFPWKQCVSDSKNSRMGGQLFKYKESIYYPAQDCNNGYGSAILIKKINYLNGDFYFDIVKRLASPHPTMKLGLHTLNEYKGVAVIDVKGYRHPLRGLLVDWLVKIKKRIK